MVKTHVEELRALRLCREAIKEGFKVSVFYEDDASEPALKDCTDMALIKPEIHACDIMSVTIRKKVMNDAGQMVSKGAWFLLVYGNGEGEGPIADHTDNDIGKRFFDIAHGRQVRPHSTSGH